MNIEEIKKQAKAELVEETFRKQVELYKEKLRNKKTIWDRIFPYKVIILKKENV